MDRERLIIENQGSPAGSPELGGTCETTNWKSKDPYDVEPGLCVIINNTDFKHGKNLPGGDKDEQDLLELFFLLRFEVKIHRNLTANEMVHKLESYSKQQHKGAFFLIILSHGTIVREREAIMGTDGKTVMMDDIESFFHATNCFTLREKPKIFLIDACRGDQKEKAYSVPRSHHGRSVPRSAGRNHSDRRVSILDTSDFLLVYASTRGHVAYTYTDKGSELIQTFIEVTNEAADNETIMNIICEIQIKVQHQGQQMVELHGRLPQPYLIKRNKRTRTTMTDELHSEFRTRVEEWIPVRVETMQKIEGIIDDLKVHHRNVNISRITGSSVSIAGSLIAITGFGLAPVTLGASIGLTAGGIAMAVAGGTTVAGASIADTIIQKSNVKQAQEQLREDYDQLYTIQVIAKIIDSNTVATSDERKECPGVGKKRVVGEILGQGLLRTSTVGMRTAEMAAANTLEIGAAALRIGGTAAKSVAAVGLVLNVALIPIDLIEIVRSSVSLARGSQTKAVEKLTEIVEQLNQQLRDLRSIIYQHQKRDQAGTGSGMGPGVEPGVGVGTGPTETGTETGAPGTGTEMGPGTGTPGTEMGPGTETEIGPVVESSMGTPEMGTETGPGTDHK